MSKAWQVQEAKARFSEFLEASVQGRAADRDEARRGGGGTFADRSVAEVAGAGEARSKGMAARTGSQDGDAHTAADAPPPSPAIGLRVARCTF